MHRLSPRQLLRYLILPMAGALLLLLAAASMKEAELREYADPTFRNVLLFTGIAVFFTGSVGLILALLARLCRYLGLDYMKRDSAGSLLFGVGSLLLGTGVIILIALTMERYNEALESGSLEHSGAIARFAIVRSRYSHGRRPHFRYYFLTRDRSGRLHELSVTRKVDELKPGDSVSIIYLPGNPTIFRETWDFDPLYRK